MSEYSHLKWYDNIIYVMQQENRNCMRQQKICETYSQSAPTIIDYYLTPQALDDKNSVIKLIHLFYVQ